MNTVFLNELLNSKFVMILIFMIISYGLFFIFRRNEKKIKDFTAIFALETMPTNTLKVEEDFKKSLLNEKELNERRNEILKKANNVRNLEKYIKWGKFAFLCVFFIIIFKMFYADITLVHVLSIIGLITQTFLTIGAFVMCKLKDKVICFKIE